MTLSSLKAAALVSVSASLSLACAGPSAPPQARATAPAVPAASSATAPPPTPAPAKAPPAVATIPSLTLEKLSGRETHVEGLFAIEGGIAVVDGVRVGHLARDHVEWVGAIPKGTPMFGDNVITSVHGRWPDRVGAVYRTSEGRAPMPTYFPIVGKGVAHVEGPGGAHGLIAGVARIGESTLVAGYSLAYGARFFPVHGPPLRRIPTPASQAGCKVDPSWQAAQAAAVTPHEAESTKAGTLVAVGRLCSDERIAAEVWDPTGASRIVDLSRFWTKNVYRTALLKGAGDEIFVVGEKFSRILRYRDGKFDPVPDLELPYGATFVSEAGALFAVGGDVLHRLDGDTWVPIGRLAGDAAHASAFAMDGDTTWTVLDGALHKLKAGPAVPVDGPCAAPFVYLYKAHAGNAPDYSYPTTRKALSTFAARDEIELVEFAEAGDRHVGVKVRSKAQGDALIAHLRQAMKDEDPRYFCYAPAQPRALGK